MDWFSNLFRGGGSIPPGLMESMAAGGQGGAMPGLLGQAGNSDALRQQGLDVLKRNMQMLQQRVPPPYAPPGRRYA